MATSYARRFASWYVFIPDNPGTITLPVDGESLVYLQLLTCLNAAAAEDTLIRIVTIKGVRSVDLIGLLLEFVGGVRYLGGCDSIVHHAIAIVIFAKGAVKVVIF
jgi:hypothetical protein